MSSRRRFQIRSGYWFAFIESAFTYPQVLWLTPEEYEGQEHKIEAMDGNPLPEHLPKPKVIHRSTGLRKILSLAGGVVPQETDEIPADVTLEEMERWVDKELIRVRKARESA